MDRRKLWKYERDRGVIHMVDAEPIRLHIQRIGLSAAEVSRQLGVHPSNIEKIANGSRLRIHAETARRVLALQVPMEPLKVPQIGVQRRLGALLRMQWSHREIKARGVRSSVLLHQKCDWVHRSTHEQVVRLYDELCMTLGPSVKSATWAKNRGYQPPLAWDEQTIDDPEALPVYAEYDGRRHGKQEEYEFLLSCGESEEQALKQLGITPRALEKWKARAA